MANRRNATRSLMALKAISETDVATLATRRDWLRFVVNPTFGCCREIAETAFQDLAAAIRRAGQRDYDSANRLWYDVRRRFGQCAGYVDAIHGLIDDYEFSAAADLLHCLGQFFTVGNTAGLPSGEQCAGGLGAAWQRILEPTAPRPDDSLEVLDAELLHTRLKWAIVSNRHLLIQTSPGAELRRAQR